MSHLQPRDRLLLHLLDAHRVLTTDQITTLLFPSLRVAQRRLARLERLGLLDRFGYRDLRGGPLPSRWTLGPHGLRLQAAARGEPPPTTRAIEARLVAVATSPTLAHQIGVNQFFCDLHAHARSNPGGRLVRWWPERWAASLLGGQVLPDGHGLWHTDGLSVAFFLEYDTGSEDLPRLLAKIAAYEKAARTGGPAWPVLLSLHSHIREEHLHRLLASAPGRCPVATTARTRPGRPPAGPVWRPLGGTGRLPLHQLGTPQPAAGGGNWQADYTGPDLAPPTATGHLHQPSQ